MGKIYQSITELVGNTPLLKLKVDDESVKAEILIKLESFNPLSSVKDRIGLNMIEEAEKQGKLKPGGKIVEATSGNTGIALAYIAAAKGYKLILTMPDTMSLERRNLLKALGAKLILTPGHKGMKGSIEKAEEIASSESDAILMQQFENPANPDIHRKTTAQEILRDTDKKLDFLVAGVGTGGTITGTGEVLKNHLPDLKVLAVEPVDSPVLSGGKPGPHKIQGIGAGFVPEVMNTELIDEVVKVDFKDAVKTTRWLATSQGVFAGISSGANVWAAMQLAKRPENAGKRIVTFICDTGERYLSTGIFD